MNETIYNAMKEINAFIVSEQINRTFKNDENNINTILKLRYNTLNNTRLNGL